MMNSLKLLLCCVTTASYAFGDDLKMVHVLWRHGDRTPVNLIPADTKNNLESWPQGLGELTPLGMAQEFKLGELIRSRYNNSFINDNYYQHQIYVRADDYNRTLMSAMANLAAFYMNGTANVSVPGWPAPYWTPVPVHTIALSEDNLLYMEAPCPRVDQLQSEVVQQQANYTTSAQQYQPLFDYLSKVCGFGYPITLDNIDDVWDPLTCELVHRDEHPWPSFINDTIYEKIDDAYAINCQYLYSYPEIARLRGGNLLGDIVSRMNQKMQSLQNPNDQSMQYVRRLNYYAYSAHDLTTLALLNTLGAANYTGARSMPGFSASLIFELWNNTDEYYVKTFYRQNATDNYIEIQVDQCPPIPNICSLETFTKRSEPFIPTDWYEECKANMGPSLRLAMPIRLFGNSANK